LPAAYLSANKATWKQAFAARTGAAYEAHQIDNINITYGGGYEYSFDAGASFQSSNTTIKVAGTYPTFIRYTASPTCLMQLGDAIINPAPAGSAGTLSATATGVCTGGTTTLSLTGQTGTILWESSATTGTGFTTIAGSGVTPLYTSGALTTNIFYRAAVTTCGVTQYSNEIAVTVYALPTITPATGVLCAGATRTVTATAPTTPATYLWSSGENTPAINASTAGTYTVTVTQGGCVATLTSVLSAVSSPTVTASVSPTTVCEGGSVNLGSTATPLSLPFSYNTGFESGLPTGWTIVNPGTGNLWTVPTTLTGTARTGTRAAEYSWNSTNAANTYMITSPMSLIAGKVYTVSSWYKSSGATFPESFRVTVGTAAIAAAQTTVVLMHSSLQLTLLQPRVLTILHGIVTRLPINFT
jgi:hypothetical protein